MCESPAFHALCCSCCMINILDRLPPASTKFGNEIQGIGEEQGTLRLERRLASSFACVSAHLVDVGI